MTFSAEGWLQMSTNDRDALVRPFYDDYLRVRAELAAAGRADERIAYNDDFRGRIPGIDPATTGTTPKDEETAIYLLQNLHTRERERAMLNEFIARGAVPLDREDVPEIGHLRGDVAIAGWYSGGTGFRILSDVRVLRHGRSLAALPKGKRTNGYRLDAPIMYFLPAQQKVSA